MKQAHIYFEGIVQGVGFRYTAQRYARDIGLTGWVRNLPDGRVEMKAEGEKSGIQDLIRRIEAHFSGSLRDKELYWQDQVEHFHEFKIVF
ncbi:MAG: acylphosphatase [Candidatus Omnitrophota bacterium]